MVDRFSSYSGLSEVYHRGEHYDVHFWPGSVYPDILIMAPHGGKIEKRTGELVKATASSDYSGYIFAGKLKANNKDELHITSERYDVPEALACVSSARIVVALHGRLDENDRSQTWMGGLDKHSCQVIGERLEHAGFPVRYDPPKFKGTASLNICNRGLSRAGVQLEIPLTMREKFEVDAIQEKLFVQALREALAELAE